MSGQACTHAQVRRGRPCRRPRPGPPGRRAWPGALALAAVLLAAPGARAQRTLVLAEPHGTAVALTVDLNAGGIWDPTPQAGVSRLAAEALLEGARPALTRLGASAHVDCGQFGLRFTMLAPPSTWRAAAELLLDAVFHPRVEEGAFESARMRLLRSLSFQAGDPAAEIRTAAFEAFFGAGHRWARGPCGQEETIRAVTVEDARTAAALRFTPARATAALTGAFVRQDAADLLERSFAGERLPLLLPLPEPPPLPGSREIESPAITTWLAVVFPLPREPDDEATRFLAARMLQALRPSPERPEVVDAAVEVERFGGGGALVTFVAAEPRRARVWAERVRALVDSAAAEPLDAPAFRLALRRYRGARLLALETPEARALDAADRLYFDHAFQPPDARIAGLTAERLRSAASALGPPAIAILGPAPAGSASLERNLRQH